MKTCIEERKFRRCSHVILRCNQPMFRCLCLLCNIFDFFKLLHPKMLLDDLKKHLILLSEKSFSLFQYISKINKNCGMLFEACRIFHQHHNFAGGFATISCAFQLLRGKQNEFIISFSQKNHQFGEVVSIFNVNILAESTFSPSTR